MMWWCLRIIVAQCHSVFCHCSVMCWSNCVRHIS